MNDARQQRIAQNEATSRRVNEAIQAHSPGERRTPGAFVCECGRSRCEHLIELTPRDYERIRRNPRRFIVRPGHEQADVERIVEAQGDYVIVEKEDEAGRLAEAEDPRA